MAAVDAATAQANAQALADSFAQAEPAATAAAPVIEPSAEDESRSNKRKFDSPPDEAEAAAKRQYNGLDGIMDNNRVSGFSDGPVDAALPAPVAAAAPILDPAAAAPGQPSDYVEIPAAMVGKLIGKGGETIKNLQYSTGTKVQIDHQTPGDLKRVTVISANQASVENCKRQIEQIVADESTDHSKTVDCPQGIVGRVIGRGGETIRALQQASQAHIVVDQNYPEGQPRKVIVSGRADAVDRAEKMIRELITGEPGSAQAIIQKYGAGITRSIECPKAMVGRVIGKGGETIKALQKNFGANIQIDQAIDPMRVTVAGQPQAVDGALAAVQEIIAGGNPPFLTGSPGPFGAGPRGPASGGYGAPGGYGTPSYGQQPGGYGGGYQSAYAPQAAPQPAYSAYQPYGAQYAPGGYAQPAPQAVQASAGYGGGYGSYGQQDPYGGGQQGPASGYGGYSQGGQGQAPAQQSAPASSLWSELRDNEGRPYYYNTQTGVSQWEKPADMA